MTLEEYAHKLWDELEELERQFNQNVENINVKKEIQLNRIKMQNSTISDISQQFKNLKSVRDIKKNAVNDLLSIHFQIKKDINAAFEKFRRDIRAEYSYSQDNENKMLRVKKLIDTSALNIADANIEKLYKELREYS